MTMATLIQSCVETQFIETTTVRLKLNASPQQSLEMNNNNNNNNNNNFNKVENLGGWSFLQSLSNVSSSNPINKEKMGKEKVYVHPLTTLYSSSSRRLGDKSLELCTENLGCETGSSDIMASNILSLSLSSPSSLSPSMEKIQEIPSSKMEYSYDSYPSPKKKMINNSINNNKTFPPPLTTMSSGSSSFRIRPHREDGRLIITAVEAPLRQPCFKAERSQGRLTLTFMEEDRAATNPKFDSDIVTRDEEEEEEEEEEENDEMVDDDCEESVELYNDFSTVNEDQNREEDGDDDGESGAYMMSKGIKGNLFEIEIEVEMGMEKFQRLINGSGGRCNDKGLCNWEPALWVATS